MTDTGQPGQPADDLTGASPPSGGEVHYPYSLPRSIFVDVCKVLPFVVIAAACLPHLPAVCTLFVGGYLGVLIVVGLLLRLLRPARPDGGVTLNEEGIRGEGWFARWDEITGIRMRPDRFRRVQLIFSEQGRSRLARFLSPARIYLPSFPVTFREVLPEIFRRRPDLAPSRKLRRATADPEAATSFPRWLGGALFVTVLALLMTPHALRHWHLIWGLVPLVLLPGVMFIFTALPVPHAPEQRLAPRDFGPVLPLALLMALGANLFGTGVPSYAVDAVAAGIAVLLLTVSIVLLTRAKLTGRWRAVILTMAVAAPALVYAHGAGTAWPKQDITHLVGSLGGGDLFWSGDAALAIEDRVDGEQQRVIDLSTLEATSLPVHAGRQTVRWLDRSCVVRTVRVEEDRALYVYSFRDGRELRMPTAETFRCGRIRCISPNGRMLCWLDRQDDGGKPSLRSYDLAEDRPGTIEVAWPPRAAKIDWRGPNWLDDEAVVVWGRDEDPNALDGTPTTLHLLHVRPEEGTTNHTTRKAPLEGWWPSPDFRHAFAHHSSDSGGIRYFDLRADRSAELAAGALPVWQTDNRCAFRAVGRGQEGTWICRFDPQTMRETALFKMPADSELIAVSPKGRLALIQRSLTRLANLGVVELATGETRWLDTPLLSSPSKFGALPRLYRGAVSVWSPAERRLVLRQLSLPGGAATYLYTLPDAWLGR